VECPCGVFHPAITSGITVTEAINGGLKESRAKQKTGCPAF
jgi:hypothetical protein